MTKDRLPWFHCYPTKWLGALAEMKPDLGYTYLIVCFRIYEKRGPIPDGIEALARRTGYRPSHVTKMIEKLCELGKLARTPEGYLTNPFAENVIATGDKIVSASVSQRSRAAKIRWEKHQSNQSKPHAGAMRGDADLELDIEVESKKVVVPRAKSRAKPRQMIAEDWQLSERGRAHAVGLGFLPDQITRMAAKFLDHHRSRGTLIADLEATWRTWCGNEIEFKQRNGGVRGKARSDGQLGFSELAAQIRARAPVRHG